MPNSYKDPAYDALDSSVESSIGLPKGLLSAIRLKGERSNADQVSSANAKSVYQIIPSTRDAALTKYNIDAYESPENAAKVAGLLLKEGLDRNKGSIPQAVGEYIGGTDRSNWGKQTHAYIARVTGGSMPNQTTTTKAPVEMPPAALEAYNSGKLTADQYAKYDAAIKSGTIAPPQGVQLAKPVNIAQSDTALDIPDAAKQRFMTDRSPEGDAFRTQVKQAIRDGYYKSTDLAEPAPRSAKDYAQMGVRTVGNVAGSLLDTAKFVNDYATPSGSAQRIATDVASKLTNSPVPEQPSYEEQSNQLGDKLGLAKPETNAEKLITKGTQSAIEFAIPIGGEAKLSRLLVDAGAGLASGLAQEKTRQAGGGQVAQTIAGLGVGASGLLAGAHVLETLGPKAAKVVEDIPASKVFTDEGHLTDEGQDIVAKSGLTEAELKQAYESGADYTQTALTKHYDDIKAAREEALAEGLPLDHPSIKKADEALAKLDQAKVVEDYVPDTVKTVPDRIEAERIADAASIDTKLTSGQVKNDFETITKENDLAGDTGVVAQEARGIKSEQQTKLNEAGDKLAQAFDTNHLDPDVKGATIIDAVQALKDQSYDNVKQLYQQLSKIKDAPTIPTDNILKSMRSVINNEGVNPSIRNGMKQLAAEYGLVGKTSHVDEFAQHHIDVGGTSPIILQEAPKKLNLANAEELNQRINKLYKAGEDNPQLGVKSVLHDEVLKTLDNVSAKEGEAGRLAQQARSAHAEHQAKFKAGDIVDRITQKKAGTDTPVMNIDTLVDNAIGSKGSMSNLKKLKVRLLSDPKGKPAWNVIQGQTLFNVLNKSLDSAGNVSFDKLNKAIKDITTDKLKLVLDPKEYNDLMRLRRVAHDIQSSGKGAPEVLKMNYFRALYHAVRLASFGFGHGAPQLTAIAATLGENFITNFLKAKENLAILEGMKNIKPNELKPEQVKLQHQAIKVLSDEATTSNLVKAYLVSSQQAKEDKK